MNSVRFLVKSLGVLVPRGVKATAFVRQFRARTDAATTLLVEPLLQTLKFAVQNALRIGPTEATPLRLFKEAVITTSRFEEDWSLEVKDDGPGISPDEREAVVRRFHRGRGSEGIAGTGLGLSVVAAILGLHGLRLEFHDAAPGLCARVIPVA